MAPLAQVHHEGLAVLVGRVEDDLAAVQRREVAAAVGAVAVGDDGERGGLVDGPAVEAQVDDAPRRGRQEPAEEQRFWDIVNTYQELSDARGGVVSRNSGRSPWVNNIDVRVAQELPGFMSGHKARVKFDILNFGNLLNKKWGRIDEVAFQSAGGQARSFVNYKGLDAQGRYIYSLGALEDLTTRQAKGESQWAMQLTFEYEF